MNTCSLRTALAGCFSLIWLTGCAGPMSPFGAINGWQSRASMQQEEALKPWSGRDTRVRFLPAHQVLHGPTPFAIVIEDPQGVPHHPQLTLSYNGMDITSAFMAQAERVPLDPDQRRVHYRIPHLRILAARENRVLATYRRVPDERPIISRYMPPTCSAFESGRSLASVPDFDPPRLMVQMINQQALSRNLNPHYVAGLIAQESGFDPQAVSRSRAVGLTQVTPLGEAEVIKGKEWPRYPGLDEMPIPMLRMHILNGRINAQNEWRLNPALSIRGGIEYLAYLSEYWSRPDKRVLIEKNLGDSDLAFSEVMLASYNSGAYRVSGALEARGKEYLQADELNEARKYVRRVVSYCDYFAHREVWE